MFKYRKSIAKKPQTNISQLHTNYCIYTKTMVNLAVFNSNFGEWRNQRASGERKGDYLLLPHDLTLLKVDDYEDFLVMDVINNINYLFNRQKV